MNSENPEIGDIIDCRLNLSLGHFILALGVIIKRGKIELMYYPIFSRVYTVFPCIVNFFNDCLSRKYNRFLIAFPKEKDKQKIMSYGRLCDTFFLDMESNYKGCLDMDSMIVARNDPETVDMETFNQWRTAGVAIYKNRLVNEDMIKLIEMIKLCQNIKRGNISQICRNYKEFKRNKN